jgi:transcriptional regulator with XRE-family HTH domain
VSNHEAFGANLRRARVRRGISLEEISARTNVSVDLWEAMERNDFSRWPTGVAARAYIRDYATIVGVDRSEVVDEFCRIAPQGDRRASRLLRGAAYVLGHELVWEDDLPPHVTEGDRRAPAAPNTREGGQWIQSNLRRLVAGVDLIVVLAAAAGIFAVLKRDWWATLAIASVAYHSLSLALIGCSPVVWAIDAYTAARQPSRRRGEHVFRRTGPVPRQQTSPDRSPAD